ncbi:MAG: hypothetical protein O2819_02555 [Planctomycetota bacterium]|nr:hypothetical protein [Planctomycetota bacterium]MDA1105799.1 hypothetical protein [Planctomycetota bacterium]
MGEASLLEPWSTTEWRTVAWVLVIAVASAAAALVTAPAVRVGSARFWVLVAAAITPPFTTWFCLWSIVAPDRPLGMFLGSGAGVTVEGWRLVALACSLLVWGGAMATLACVAWREARPSDALVRLDGATFLQRFRIEWHRRAPGAAAGGMAVALVLSGESTVFDLAQVRTVAFELRSLVALGTPTAEVLWLSAPMFASAVVLAGIGSCALARRLQRRASETSEREVDVPLGTGARVLAGLLPASGALALLCVTVVPWFIAGDESLRIEHIAGALRSIAEALAVGVALSACAVGAWWWLAVRRRGRWAIASATSLTLVAAAMPPALVATLVREVSDGWPALLLGHAVRLAPVAWIGALVAWSGVDPALVDAARLTGRGRPLLMAQSPMLRRLAGTTLAIGTLLAFTDVSLSSLLEPVGADRLATRLVDALHYQRPGPIVLVLPIVGIAVVGWCAVRWWRVRGKAIASVVLAMALGCSLAGCDQVLANEHEVSTENPSVRLVIGSPGRSPGCFEMPRALSVDPADGSIVVIDKTGRVQRFSGDGTLLNTWKMPAVERGKPTGVSIGPDGSIWVADTHEHRVVRFDREGNLLQVVGEGGTGPGQFIYPTDVAIRSDGRILVSEYGGNDRIHEFAADGSWLRCFGVRGPLDDSGIEEERLTGIPHLDRPQAIVLDEAAGRLFVADACHHRIVELDLDGRFIRAIGSAGMEHGHLWYPYGVDRLGDGELVVSEFGANRLQVIDLESAAITRSIGSGGSDVGQFAAPWAVAVRGGRVHVCDSRNGRVQVLEP